MQERLYYHSHLPCRLQAWDSSKSSSVVDDDALEVHNAILKTLPVLELTRYEFMKLTPKKALVLLRVP